MRREVCQSIDKKERKKERKKEVHLPFGRGVGQLRQNGFIGTSSNH
jgi:hypothetical protein